MTTTTKTTFLDAGGNPYPADLPYYQPSAESELIDKDGTDWPSFAVWKDKDACQALFPNHRIDTYHGDAIEEPTFVD